MSICLIGNFCMDLIIRGVPAMPAWGREAAGTDYALFSSGQTTYTAFALRALGDPVSVVGCVGDDDWGRRIRADLDARGVDTECLQTVSGGRTAVTVAVVRPDGERAFVSSFGCLADAGEAVILRGWRKVEQARVACLLGAFCWPGLPLCAAAGLFRRARAAGVATMLDTGWDPGGWPPETLAALRALLAETTLFMPNQDEAAAITERTEAEDAARELSRMGPELVVVKRGGTGSIALAEGRLLRQPALPAVVVDTVGAGDVFNAGFLHARVKGRSLEQCLRFGAATAAVYISRPRDRFPSAGEVKA